MKYKQRMVKTALKSQIINFLFGGLLLTALTIFSNIFLKIYERQSDLRQFDIFS